MPKSVDTPLMQQWREIKSRHQDALVFFRVGDFFELFYGDAEEGSRLLGLTLTSRNNGAAARVPLAGVPVKALDEYLARLVQAGRRVAICDQVEDPSQAKGIVRREVTHTLTPGTVIEDALLTARENHFLVALSPPWEKARGLAALDLSTGELMLQRVDEAAVADELGRLEGRELLLPRTAEGDEATWAAPPPVGPVRTYRDDWIFDGEMAAAQLKRRYRVQSLEAFGFQKEDGLLVQAAGALVSYLDEIRPGGTLHLRPPRIERPGGVMVLDEMTRRNLELVEPLRSGEEGGTLLTVLDDAVTAMGARRLRRWTLWPLSELRPIWDRQDAVEELVERPPLRRSLRERLEVVGDLERLAGKVGGGRVTPRELVALGRSLAQVPVLKGALEEARAPLLVALVEHLDPLEDVRSLLESAMAEDAPASLQDGGVIRRGYSRDLDELYDALGGARDFIAGLQARERERTGIASLKIGFNKVFGYYLEVTRANLGKVPDHYHRKQTLTGAERFFTPELKEWEEKVLGAEERIQLLEAELFAEVRGRVAEQVGRVQATAEGMCDLDVLATLAEVSVRRGYVRPEVTTGFDLRLRAGRHPVVETMMPREAFIPNDLILDEEKRIVVLTGPNMAGKSTVLRQAGLIQLLAQMGSFVPADDARLPICDRIFTRVGASDNLARGQSTFMVEMNETAAILHGATERSLILLDEIGRGTSTYDGVSIAWAVTEYLHEKTRSKTIFATHYHELTQLGDLLPGVKNLNVIVREVGETVVFLRRLEEGGADRSYGIQVARLAGLPEELIERAAELLRELEGTHTRGGEGLGRHGRHRPTSEASLDQLSLFQQDPVLERLRNLDPDRMTPLEALSLLTELSARARGE